MTGPGLVAIACLAVLSVVLAIGLCHLVRTRGRVIALVEALSRGDEVDERRRQGLHDRELEQAFRDLAGRLAGTQMLATTDALTGALNRQTTLTLLAAEIERAARYKRPLSVCLLDVDHFKNVNDTFGHDAGDVVLNAIARTVQASVRSGDVVGRYGGEEFLVILPETDVEPAAVAAEHLRRLVAARPVQLPDGSSLPITISGGVAGGVAGVAGGRLSIDGLVRDADSALYAAKSLGRDQVYIFRELDETRSIRRAPIDPGARRTAIDVGRVAADAARDRLADILSSREPWSGKPSELISRIAVTLGADLGLSDAELNRIRTAAILHDVGKLAIPDEILAKPARLTDTEWRAVVEHPKIGQVVMEQAGALRDAAALIVHHHEWFNGRGYPHGIAGRDIPLGARILAIADSYEAITSGRPYQAARTHEEALAELERCAGTQFDPEIVALFRDQFEHGIDGVDVETGEAAARDRNVRSLGAG